MHTWAGRKRGIGVTELGQDVDRLGLGGVAARAGQATRLAGICSAAPSKGAEVKWEGGRGAWQIRMLRINGDANCCSPPGNVLRSSDHSDRKQEGGGMQEARQSVTWHVSQVKTVVWARGRQPQPHTARCDVSLGLPEA